MDFTDFFFLCLVYVLKQFSLYIVFIQRTIVGKNAIYLSEQWYLYDQNGDKLLFVKLLFVDICFIFILREFL